MRLVLKNDSWCHYFELLSFMFLGLPALSFTSSNLGSRNGVSPNFIMSREVNVNNAKSLALYILAMFNIGIELSIFSYGLFLSLFTYFISIVSFIIHIFILDLLLFYRYVFNWNFCSQNSSTFKTCVPLCCMTMKGKL